MCRQKRRLLKMRQASKECEEIDLELSNVLTKNLKCRNASVAFMPYTPA